MQKLLLHERQVQEHFYSILSILFISETTDSLKFSAVKDSELQKNVQEFHILFKDFQIITARS